MTAGVWTVPRLAGRMHREVFAPLGFERKGNVSIRADNGLIRSVRVYSLAANKGYCQLLVSVALDGLPPKLTRARYDTLWGAPGREGRYVFPPRDAGPPPELFADLAGPVQDFLLAADDLAGFVVWAQEVYLGREHRGFWGAFTPVMPQGTAPLQAAAYAAVLLGDRRLADLLDRRVENEEGSEHYLSWFREELHALYRHFNL